MTGACARREELLTDVQSHLIRLADLARREAEAIKNEYSHTWLALDKEIEMILGEKERSLGALVEHRKEHGC